MSGTFLNLHADENGLHIHIPMSLQDALAHGNAIMNIMEHFSSGHADQASVHFHNSRDMCHPIVWKAVPPAGPRTLTPQEESEIHSEVFNDLMRISRATGKGSE